MSIEQTTLELRGQAFLGTIEKVPNLGEVDRTCDVCFYRLDDDCCCASEPKPHNLFGITGKDLLPTILSNKEVGNYCPYWQYEL